MLSEQSRKVILDFLKNRLDLDSLVDVGRLLRDAGGVQENFLDLRARAELSQARQDSNTYLRNMFSTTATLLQKVTVDLELPEGAREDGVVDEAVQLLTEARDVTSEIHDRLVEQMPLTTKGPTICKCGSSFAEESFPCASCI